jgi:hypothetical protein
MQEVWRPVVGYEGLYEVSDQGRVRSLPRSVLSVDGKVRRFPGKVLKGCVGSHGYLCLNLCKGGAPKAHLVHALVAEAFLGPCPEGQEVCHSERGKHDNRSSSLRYGTRKENAADKHRDGSHIQGERHGCAKLTEAQARYVHTQLRNYSRGTVPRLARELGVALSTIQSIKEKRNWAWLARLDDEV